MDLTNWLNEKGWPQAELARRVGVHPQTVRRWVAGWEPTQRLLVKINRVTRGRVTRADFPYRGYYGPRKTGEAGEDLGRNGARLPPTEVGVAEGLALLT